PDLPEPLRRAPGSAGSGIEDVVQPLPCLGEALVLHQPRGDEEGSVEEELPVVEGVRPLEGEVHVLHRIRLLRQLGIRLIAGGGARAGGGGRGACRGSCAAPGTGRARRASARGDPRAARRRRFPWASPTPCRPGTSWWRARARRATTPRSPAECSRKSPMRGP